MKIFKNYDSEERVWCIGLECDRLYMLVCFELWFDMFYIVNVRNDVWKSKCGGVCMWLREVNNLNSD